MAREETVGQTVPEHIQYWSSYTEDELKPNQSISYGHLSDRRHEDDVPLVLSPYLTYSDYSGSMMEKSNVASVLEDYGEHDDVHEVTGGYGTHAIAIRADSEDEDLIEILESLEAYPVLDESKMSEMEMEEANEAWESWGRHDFRKALEDQWGVDVDWLSDASIDTIAFETMDEAGIYWEHGSEGPYLALDLLAKAVNPMVPAHLQRWRLMMQYWTPQGFTNGSTWED